MLERIELRNQILTCTECGLSQKCKAPVPFEGPSPAKLVVVGEAPGRQEDEVSRPFVGVAGQLLRHLMELAGLPIDKTMFINAASCFPIDFEGKGRAPNDMELKACSKNLHDQLELSQTTYVLLVGRIPYQAFRPCKTKISRARGNPFILGGTREVLGNRLFLPTYHPSYVLRRGGEDSDAAHEVARDMKLLADLMEAGRSKWISLFPETCIECGDEAGRFSDDAVGYCSSHWEDQ